MNIYPITLTFKVVENVRVPNYVWDWNATPPRQVEHSSATYRQIVTQRNKTVEVAATDAVAAWKAAADLPELKGVPVVGSDLVGVMVGGPLAISMVAWMKRQRALSQDPVVWRKN